MLRNFAIRASDLHHGFVQVCFPRRHLGLTRPDDFPAVRSDKAQIDPVSWIV